MKSELVRPLAEVTIRTNHCDTVEVCCREQGWWLARIADELGIVPRDNGLRDEIGSIFCVSYM